MKFAAVLLAMVAGSAFAQQPSQCMKWKYICSEKDEYGTCIAWETDCILWGPPPSEGLDKPRPGTGEGSTRISAARTPAPGLVPPFILDSMSRGVDSFELVESGGQLRIVNIVRSPGGPR